MRVTVTIDDGEPVIAFAPVGEGLASEWLNASVESLTARECQVLRLVAAGLHYKDIARQINCSEPTVRTHVYSACGKLGLSSNALITWGLLAGIVNPSDIRAVWADTLPHLVRKEE